MNLNNLIIRINYANDVVRDIQWSSDIFISSNNIMHSNRIKGFSGNFIEIGNNSGFYLENFLENESVNSISVIDSVLNTTIVGWSNLGIGSYELINDLRNLSIVEILKFPLTNYDSFNNSINLFLVDKITKTIIQGKLKYIINPSRQLTTFYIQDNNENIYSCSMDDLFINLSDAQNYLNNII